MNITSLEFVKKGLSLRSSFGTSNNGSFVPVSARRRPGVRRRTDGVSQGDRTSSYKAARRSHPPATTSKVVLLRHGQSTWNKIPTFSGWCDVPLTDRGISQAEGAARVMKDRGLNFDLAFSSELQRAYVSAEVVLEAMGDESTPIIKAWQLNERHYGALQGLAKSNPELLAKYGNDQMTEWRRSMMGKPPPMDDCHPHFAPPPAPRTESLHDCQVRVLRYWDETIVPAAAAASHSDRHVSTVLVAAHANTIRALVAYLDEISHDDVPRIHIPNSVPCVYTIDTQTGRSVRQDDSPLSSSAGCWMLSSENQERLMEKLGGNSEAFARSVFDAWDLDGNGVLSKEELVYGLSAWKRDANPAIDALAGKIWEEIINYGEPSGEICLEKFQSIAILGSRKHNLPFFLDEEPKIPYAA